MSTASAFQALGESSVGTRHLVDHVAHRRPVGLARLAAAHDRRQRVEAAAAEPELAVERLGRQRGDE
jgi:hypothetical protein